MQFQVGLVPQLVDVGVDLLFGTRNVSAGFLIGPDLFHQCQQAGWIRLFERLDGDPNPTGGQIQLFVQDQFAVQLDRSLHFVYFAAHLFLHRQALLFYTRTGRLWQTLASLEVTP
jgi:hypothetical protein